MESLILYDLFKQYGIQDTLPKIQKYVDWNKLMNIIESPIIPKNRQRPRYEGDFTVNEKEFREFLLERNMSEIKKAYAFYKKWYHNYDIEKYEIHLYNHCGYTFTRYVPSRPLDTIGCTVEIKYLNGWHGENFCFQCPKLPKNIISMTRTMPIPITPANHIGLNYLNNYDM